MSDTHITTTKSPTISAVVVGHDSDLDDIIIQLKEQTYPPEEIIAVFCCLDQSPDADIIVEDIHRGDWGHLGRDIGLRLATKDYIMFANSDDEYKPEFIEKLLELNADLAYCNWDEYGKIFDAFPALGSITAGNFIVKRELAQSVGWNHRDYLGDGRFIMEIMERFPTYAHTPEVLYAHH